MFTIRALRYKHILDIPALDLAGPVVCLSGPSGSGKTTLLRHLNRLIEPNAGEITYNDHPLAQINPLALRRRVVMLGQTPVLYEGTVEDNLQIGLHFSQDPPATRAQLEEALVRVGLDKGLDSLCHKLSGGERQRLCMARVMLMDAETYLMDEPSAALDRETEALMIGNLAAFARERGRQLILVSHSPQVEEMFPGALVRLDRGRVREVGA